MGCPLAPVYKGGRGGGAASPRGAPGGVLLPPGVGLPLLPCWKRKEEGRKRKGPPLPCPIRTKGGGGTRPALAGPPLLPYGPCRPNNPWGGSGNPPGTPVKSRFHPERFRYPNIGFQYINLYVPTISRLLVMSVITSGTLNNLRYIKTQKP